MSYDAANRLTTSLLGATQLTTYTYSNAGEMTGEQCDVLGVRSTFVYDAEHRCLNELRASGANHTYTYAFDGLRRSAHMAGTANAVSFVWDGTDLLNEYVPGGLSGRYLTLDGEVLSEKRGASRYVYGVDPLGSVVHLLDSGLNRAATYVYWPYGDVQSHTGVDTPMQFVGRFGYFTSTTNRVYVRARWLRPDLGRWLTEDPIGFDGGDWNLYAYVGCRPGGHRDPTGTYRLDIENCDGAGANGRSHRYWIEQMMRNICVTLAGRHSDFDNCVAAECTAPQVPHDCLAGACGSNVPIKIYCVPDYGRTCGPGDCAKSIGIFPPWTINICRDALRPTSSCARLGCVLLHELIHRCGNICHPWDRSFGCSRHRNEDRLSDCKCFHCVNRISTDCDRYYAFPGGPMIGEADCAKTPQTACGATRWATT
jgi:RHS repeat-associated protein